MAGPSEGGGSCVRVRWKFWEVCPEGLWGGHKDPTGPRPVGPTFKQPKEAAPSEMGDCDVSHAHQALWGGRRGPYMLIHQEFWAGTLLLVYSLPSTTRRVQKDGWYRCFALQD